MSEWAPPGITNAEAGHVLVPKAQWDAMQPPPGLYVAPDRYGVPTVWRDLPNGHPMYVMTIISGRALDDWIARVLPRRDA